jgi:pimeloyl-ACP methyl ester carboxylesterase
VARRAVGAILLVASLAAACTVGPSSRPPVAVRGADLSAAPYPSAAAPTPLPSLQPQHTTLPLADCTAGTLAGLGVTVPVGRTLRADCGNLTVPLDPAQPVLGAVTLGVVRVGLTDAPGRTPLASRPPLLVMGDTATDPTAARAARLAAQVPDYLLSRYALIGLDRRGTGIDTLDCADPTAREALVDDDPATLDAAALLEQARAVVQACNVALDGQLNGFSSASAAADVEVVRQALGVARLSAIGTGDGAAALADWARAHPGAVGRLVLDGPPDPTTDEPDRSEARARSAEAAFDAFALNCTASSVCPLGKDPRATVTTLVNTLRTQPLINADGQQLTAGATLTAIRTSLGEPATWAALTDALTAAAAGNPAPMLAQLAPLIGQRGRYDAVLATDCNDVQNRIAPAQIQDLAQKWRTAYPLFGGTFAADLVACAPWPTGDPAAVVPVPPDLPPLAVVGTAAGPRVPVEASQRVAQSMPSAIYIGWEGAATGAFPRTLCVNSLIDNLLVDASIPDAGILCPP